MVRLTVLSRSYCHLCDDMIAALEMFQGRFSLLFEIEVVDVDGDPAVEMKWGDKVPVLLHGEHELCHYFLDESALHKHLSDLQTP